MTNDFGRLLRQHRKKNDLSQSDLLDELKEKGHEFYSKGTVSKWENGKSQPNADVIEDLEDILGFKRGDLLRPAGLLQEKIAWSQQECALDLAIANLLGSWDEKYAEDVSTASQLAKEEYSKWIQTLRTVLLGPASPLTLKNGIWAVSKRKLLWQELGPMLFDDQLEGFKRLAVAALTELDPRFELPPEERFAAGVRGKVLKHSQHLRKGLAESLAILGNYPAALSNCSFEKPEITAVSAIREILCNTDWKLWGSLNSLLPLLAEAAPGEFLDSVETAMHCKPSPFDELFSQEGKGAFGENYVTGLLWALETLAWEERYLVRATAILGELALRDPGGNWANRPINSLRTIFLPWHPQTMAPLEKQKLAIQNLQKENPEIAWKLLLGLMPHLYQVSSGSRKPVWRQAIPKDWRQKVSPKDYTQQVEDYADMIVEMAEHDANRFNVLITHLETLPPSSLDKVLFYLSSEATKNTPESERIGLWAALVDLASKHKKYADAKWAFTPELVSRIDGTIKMLTPHNPQDFYRRLFGNNNLELFEEKGNWQAEQVKFEELRQHAVKEIIANDDVGALLSFADTVESPLKIGFSLGSIVDLNIDLQLLPSLLKTVNIKLAQVASGFISGRFSNLGWAWVDGIDTALWSKSQISKFLAYLPFTLDTWQRAKKLLGESEGDYWESVNVNPFQTGSELGVAVDKLLEHNRPNAAIQCLYVMLHEKQPFDRQRAIQALLGALTSAELPNSMDAYGTIELIKALQADPDTNPAELLRIEWAYLPLLDRDRGASPKLLENRLASDPNFFHDVISIVYRSKKKAKAEKEESNPKVIMVAENAYRLLHEWQTPPGAQDNGFYSGDAFKKWLEQVQNFSLESGHLEVALTHIGSVLIHCPADPDGLWINRTAAEALNGADAGKMRVGFSLGVYNARGAHFVDPTGKPELELAAVWRKKAEEVENAGYSRFAAELEELADSYVNEARRIVDEHKHEINDT